MENLEKKMKVFVEFFFLSFTESKRNCLVIVGCGWLSEHRFTTSEDIVVVVVCAHFMMTIKVMVRLRQRFK